MRQARLGPIDVEVPETRRERRLGLRRLPPLEPGHGLLLQRCSSVHTFGMTYAIDAVLVDRTYRVLRVVRLEPRRVLLPSRRVRHVLEVRAGEAPPVGSRLRLTPAARA